MFFHFLVKASLCLLVILNIGCKKKTDFELIQEKLEEKNVLLGVGYLGNLTDKESFQSFVNYWYEKSNLDIFKNYDFGQILIQEGNEVYCVIPSKNVESISIYEFDLNYYEVTGGKGNLLYENNEQKVIYLVGNVSEIVSNFYICIKDKNEKIHYYLPSLSLKDSSLNLIDGVVIDINSWLAQ